MTVTTTIVHANGLDVYCELRGAGPVLALIPSGEGDCGSYAQVADRLADEFSVVTLDMRGCSRTSGHPKGKPISPELLADDIAAILRELNLAPATVYGCSSGGQACLALGLYHGQWVRNIIVHEAALLRDAPTDPQGDGMATFFGAAINHLVTVCGSKTDAMRALLTSLCGDEAALTELGQAYLDRIDANAETWIDCYLPHAADRSYTQQELSAMPPLAISASMLSPAWIAESNRRIAQRAGATFTWLSPPNMHFPQITGPELLAEYIRNTTRPYL